MTNHILRIDASARHNSSVTRDLNDRIITKFEAAGATDITTRDLSKPLPHITEDWIGANFTAPAERTETQQDALALSDALVNELKAANVLLIGLPIYNFSIPAALKAWIDLVARVGETFRYTSEGPKGLLTGKRAIVSVASGGTKRGSEIDFATDYLVHILSFMGINDVTFVSSDQRSKGVDASKAQAETAIDNLSLAA